MLRKQISFLVLLVFAVLAMPSISHAHEVSGNVERIDVSAVQDHGDNENVTTASAEKSDCDHSGGLCCCDKDCQCISGCGAGHAQILSSGALPLPSPASAMAQTGYYEEIADTGLVSRIKRPPRA